MITSMKLKTYLGCAGLAAAACVAVAAVPAPASAQSDYSQGGGYDTGYQGPPDEVGAVTVYASPYLGHDAATGAPYEMVRVSRVVDYSDLDPYSAYGAHVLRIRVERAAEAACNQIDAEYPNTTDDQPPCVRTAVQRAMYDVHHGY
jgi:UrcA family protein